MGNLMGEDAKALMLLLVALAMLAPLVAIVVRGGSGPGRKPHSGFWGSDT